MSEVIIGNNLKTIRKERKLTIKQAAQKFGCSHRTWENWESGGLKRAAFEEVDKLADFFELDNCYILFEYGEVENPHEERDC